MDHKEKQKIIMNEKYSIAWKLCGFFIPHDEIAEATGLSEEVVLIIRNRRTELYNKEYLRKLQHHDFNYWARLNGYIHSLPEFILEELSKEADKED